MNSRICLSCIVASLFLVFFSSSLSESDLPQAELLSYDYSSNINFGTGYQTYSEFEKSSIYINQQNVDQWIKLWLRIHIFTPQKKEWNHTLQYSQAINVSNVKVSSPFLESTVYIPKLLPSSNAFPLNSAPGAIVDSYDHWDEYWEKLFPNWSLSSPYNPTCYWSQKMSRGETEWILELIIKNTGQDEKEINVFVNSLSIQCEIDADYYEIDAKDIQVKTGNAQREVRFDNNAVQFRANSFFEEHFEDANKKIAYLTDPDNVLLFSNDAYLNAFHEAPEQYSLVGISVTMLKQMPWVVCDVEASLIPNDTVIGIITEPSDAINDRDRWKNGYYNMYPVFVVVKSEHVDEQKLMEDLNKLTLYLTFSTEFAGNNDFSRTESFGYPGIRFTMQVNMANIMTSDEIDERIGNISDG